MNHNVIRAFQITSKGKIGQLNIQYDNTYKLTLKTENNLFHHTKYFYNPV